MKIAIVTDRLIQFGGMERFLQILLEIYPDADVFTSFADKNMAKTFIPSLSFNRLYTFPLQIFQDILLKYTSILQLFAPFLWKIYDFKKYDIVISSSSSLMCNLINVRKPIHIQYIQCIPKNLFGLARSKKLQKIIPYTSLLKYFYTKKIRSSPYIIANSKFTQKSIYDIFKVKSKVIYPPVRFPKSLPKKDKPKYFIIVSRLSPEKNIELAIKACNELKLPLKIIGETGVKKYKQFLSSIAGPTIEFMGQKTDQEIDELYKYAIAFLFTAENEDFGIAPVEAIAHGVPVITYYSGGLKETITNKTNGLFYKKQSINYLINTLISFNISFKKLFFTSKLIQQTAIIYSKNRFKSRLKGYIKDIYN